MRTIKIICAVFVLTVIPGCLRVFNNGNNSLSKISSPILHERTIISSWFNLSLFPISDRAKFYLEGTEYFNKSVDYDKDHYVELAYVMMPDNGAPVYKRLPMNLTVLADCKSEEFSFRFAIDHIGFSLSVKNLDPTVIAIDPQISKDFFYRYIIIPRSLFNSLTIDWDNYDKVAQALTLQPSNASTE
jgi:hypothetical protein